MSLTLLGPQHAAPSFALSRTGYVFFDYGTSFTSSIPVILQGGEYLVGSTAGTFTPSADTQPALSLFTTAGVLDLTFGTAGQQLIPKPGGLSQASPFDQRVQSNGKFVLAGGGQVGSALVFFLTRLNADFSLDTGFGTSGYTTAAYSTSTYNLGSRIGIQSSGKIVMTGQVYGDAGQTFAPAAVARFNTDGSLDATFGASGWATTSSIGGFPFFFAYDLLLLPDDSILIVGLASNTLPETGSRLAVLKYTPNGVLDTTFATSGIFLFDDGTPCMGLSLARQSDGSLIVGGGANIDGSHDAIAALVLRLSASGVQDSTFNGNTGRLRVDLMNRRKIRGVGSLGFQSSGKIIAVCGSHFGGEALHVFRVNTVGTLDLTFGDSGTGGFTWVEQAHSLVIGSASLLMLADDRIVIAGNDAGEHSWILRLTSQGVLDPLFATGVIVIATSPPAGIWYAEDPGRVYQALDPGRRW